MITDNCREKPARKRLAGLGEISKKVDLFLDLNNSLDLLT